MTEGLSFSPDDPPAGLKLFAVEFCGVWPIVCKGEETLAFEDGKGVVAKSTEVVIEHDIENQPDAAKFASKLSEMGWLKVVMQQVLPLKG